MGIYYVSGVPYSSDELYHHGICGIYAGEGNQQFESKRGTTCNGGTYDKEVPLL